jgi:hypothetical protein
VTRALAALVLALAACDEVTGADEVKLGRRSRDAGPAVVIVDRSERGAALHAAAEGEPNDEPGKGQPLTVPGAVRGRIDRAGDRDVYAIALPVAGTLKVALSGVDDADLVLEVLQPGGELLAVCDNGPAKVAEGFPNLFVQPGPLLVVVREFVKPAPKPKKGKKPAAAPGRAAPSSPYVLEVRLLPAPAPGEEREPNDQAAFADELALGATGRGLVGWKRDTDTWRVPLEGVRDDEALSVDVEGIEGVALKVGVVDGAGQVVLERKGRPGASVSLRSVAIPAGAGTLFVVVTGDRADDGEPYTVRAQTAALVLDEESEPNDAPEAASPLADVPGTTSGTRVGTLAAGDVDCFRLDAGERERQLDVIFSPPASVDGAVAALTAEGVALGPAADAGKKGAPERLAARVPAGKAAIVKLTGKAGEAAERYKLRWTVTDVEEAEETPVPGVDE